MDLERHKQYDATLIGHRAKVGKVFDALDLKKSGQIKVTSELKVAVQKAEGAKFSQDKFMEFWSVKAMGDDGASKQEFSFYMAEMAGKNSNMADLLDKYEEVAKELQEAYALKCLEKKTGAS